MMVEMCLRKAASSIGGLKAIKSDSNQSLVNDISDHATMPGEEKRDFCLCVFIQSYSGFAINTMTEVSLTH